jgi:hypothetical protein
LSEDDKVTTFGNVSTSDDIMNLPYRVERMFERSLFVVCSTFCFHHSRFSKIAIWYSRHIMMTTYENNEFPSTARGSYEYSSDFSYRKKPYDLLDTSRCCVRVKLVQS